jgi:uncharacterized damage-inducible protein DinB
MITPAYVRTMAAYNSEMNRRLYAAASRLSDAERKRDRNAFWGSLHNTLVHILWGDGQWMSRFDGWVWPTTPIKDSGGMLEDWAELSTRRVEADAKIEDWARRVDDAYLARDMTWFSGAARGDGALPALGDAFLQPPDASSRPGACADHRRRRENRGYRSVPGGSVDDCLIDVCASFGGRCVATSG